jgi:hypothetical protein
MLKKPYICYENHKEYEELYENMLLKIKETINYNNFNNQFEFDDDFFSDLCDCLKKELNIFTKNQCKDYIDELSFIITMNITGFGNNNIINEFLDGNQLVDIIYNNILWIFGEDNSPNLLEDMYHFKCIKCCIEHTDLDDICDDCKLEVV